MNNKYVTLSNLNYFAQAYDELVNDKTVQYTNIDTAIELPTYLTTNGDYVFNLVTGGSASFTDYSDGHTVTITAPALLFTSKKAMQGTDHRVGSLTIIAPDKQVQEYTLYYYEYDEPAYTYKNVTPKNITTNSHTGGLNITDNDDSYLITNNLPVENFHVTGTDLNLITTTEMGTHVYYVTMDSSFRYKVNGDTSWHYVSGPGMVYSYKDGSDADMDKWYDIMFYSVDKIVKYHKDYYDSFPSGYKEVAFDANNNNNGVYHITADTTVANLTGNNDIGVVTNTSGITLSWIDYTSSDSESMTLPCGTFILGSTNAAALGNGDNVQIIKPTSEQYVITNITSTAATVTETTPTVVTSISSSSTDTEIPTAKCVYDAIQGGGGSSLDVNEIDTAGTYTLDTFTAHTKTIITGANVNLTYDETLFHYHTGNDYTVTKALPKGTEITCDSINRQLYVDTKDGWNYYLLYTQDTIPKAQYKPDETQPVFSPYSAQNLISSYSSDMAEYVYKILNEFYTTYDHLDSNPVPVQRPFFKNIDINSTAPMMLYFKYTFYSGMPYVKIQVPNAYAIPSSLDYSYGAYGVTYKKLVKASTYIDAYAKASEFFTRSVTALYSDTNCTQVITNWALSTASVGYILTTPDLIIGKNNTEVYTPTSNYQPSTKKYVDDKVQTALPNATALSSAPFIDAASALNFDTLEKGFYRYDWMGTSVSMYYKYTNTNNTVQTKSFTVSNTDSTGTTGTTLNFRRIEIEVYNKWTDVKTADNNTPIAKIKFYPSSTFYYDSPATQYSAYYVEYVFYKYNNGISKDLQGAYIDNRYLGVLIDAINNALNIST